MEPLENERHLIALALALGARDVAGWSAAETALVSGDLPSVSRALVRDVRARITQGRDPLGDAFSELRSPEDRRPQGATYTPSQIVRVMIRWAAALGKPNRVVDPGTGSARFLAAAARKFPDASLIGVELDPLAALVARAHLATINAANRSQIIVGDYRDVALPPGVGRTLYIGNPPYVRHHLITPAWKEWLARTAAERKLDASQLAGLYVYFFLATVVKAQPGDFGTFITAAEWMDVNYGRLIRQMFLGPLGGKTITLVEPTVRPFPDAATTAAITCFEIGAKPRSIRLKRVDELDAFGNVDDGGRLLRRERLETANRWTPLTRLQRKTPEGFVELGELCRVHRGQVTGSNRVWIAGEHSVGLPDAVQFASVTKARELFKAQGVLRNPAALRRVIDLPVDLDTLDGEERKAVDVFLKRAKAMGAHEGYIARNRKAWWAVGLREPAPILTTYMARRPPAFVRNLADARHINIAHGIYPREPLSEVALAALANHLTLTVGVESGRTYAGGLTKFEPKEVERLFVPDLPALNAGTA